MTCTKRSTVQQLFCVALSTAQVMQPPTGETAMAAARSSHTHGRHSARAKRTSGPARQFGLPEGLRPLSTSGGPGHPFYNLIQLCKLLNVCLAAHMIMI